MAKLANKEYNVSFIKDLSLVDASFELNKVKDGKKELKFIKRLLEKEPELVSVLTDPNMKEKEKHELIEGVFKGNVSDQMVDLLKKIFVKYTDVVTVTVITAVPMEEDSLEKLRDILKAKLDKDIILDNQIDKTIIGGVLLKVGDKILDGTLKSQLESIRKTLKDVSF